MTDQETVELITESSCLQFFIALRSYQAVSPFDPAMMVHFRKCLGPDLIKICKEMAKSNGIARLAKTLASLEENIGNGEENKQLAASAEATGLGSERLESGSTLMHDATSAPDDAISYHLLACSKKKRLKRPEIREA